MVNLSEQKIGDATGHPPAAPPGIRLYDDASINGGTPQIDRLIAHYGLEHLTHRDIVHGECTARLTADFFQNVMQNFNTLSLSDALRKHFPDDDLMLEREIFVAMLGAPVSISMRNTEELTATIRTRRDTVLNASRTQMQFCTGSAERPQIYWRYVGGAGFCLQPGVSLIEALRSATQPAPGQRAFTFSCYRASEYVMLLAFSMQLAHSNPSLLQALQARWNSSPIQSAKFHELLLAELGSVEHPLPMSYYVPGDRVWFRNPDATSAYIAGYEGYWVIYLGHGKFSNFWDREHPYTLESKCIEIDHWRNAVVPGSDGEPAIDEQIVADQVAKTTADPLAVAHILGKVKKIRDAQGCYGAGGCIDASREFFKANCFFQDAAAVLCDEIAAGV